MNITNQLMSGVPQGFFPPTLSNDVAMVIQLGGRQAGKRYKGRGWGWVGS